MHIHLPKPLHGWREFAGEVGIIVIGILIALAGEQVVESLHWRSETREFRQAVDHELAIDLGTFQFNQLQQRCTRSRLGELQTMLDRARNGRPVHLSGSISGPLQISQYTSVWDNKDAQVVAHLPPSVRLKYAELYDEFRATADVKAAQTEAWANLEPFDEPGPLDLADRRNLHALITRAGSLASAMDSNWPVALRDAAALGIEPHFEPEAAVAVRSVDKFPICRPILGDAQ